MNYYYCITDSNGFTHSIDNLHIQFEIKATSYNIIKKTILPKIQTIKDKFPNLNYYDRLDLNGSRKYYFCKDFLHVDDGIMVYCGVQFEKLEKGTSKSGENVVIFPKIRLEFNPNKYGKSDVLKFLLPILQEYACEAQIIKYDYAVDVPQPLNDIQVFSTLKQRGLFKGTRYFGQRGQNGFTRIYDKAKEQNLDYPLTRIETVCKLSKNRITPFEKVYVKQTDTSQPGVLKGTDKAIVELCQRVSELGGEVDDILMYLDKRKRYKIKENLDASHYALLEYDDDIREKLLERMEKDFSCIIGADILEEDENGFIKIPDNIELPFDL